MIFMYAPQNAKALPPTLKTKKPPTFAKMKTETDFKLNPYYKTAHEDSKPEELKYSLADLFDNIKFDE